VTYVPQQKANLIIAAAAMPHPAATDARDERAAGVPSRVAPRWRRMRRRTLVLALLAAAVPVTVTAAVVELTGGPPPHEAPLPTLGVGPSGRVTPREALPALPAALSDVYARLGRAATADDRDNALVRKAVAHARQFGLAAGQARVMATVDGRRVWLMPGNGFVCIGVQTVGDDVMDTGCETQAVALKYGLSVSNTERIYGLLPDGVRQIEVTDDNGFHHVESVNDNVYVLPPVGATIRYRDGSGDVIAFRVIIA
jgi:hypothetical protein